MFVQGVSMTSHLEKCEAFKALHEARATFIIPNPWDAGSAVQLEEAGFKALATTSAGFAWTLGRKDGQVSLDEKLEHCRAISQAISIPINADFENGFADGPDDAAANLVKVASAGVSGASIEDSSGKLTYEFDHAVERIAACAQVVAKLDHPFMLTARTDALLHGETDLGKVIERLKAFEAAGADVLYAPGLKTFEDVDAVMQEVSKPINVLAAFLPQARFADYKAHGVCRISIGGALAAHARAKTKAAADQMMGEGSFSWG